MNCTKAISTGLAVVIGATLLVTPTTSIASNPMNWTICPAIDGEPLCELVDQYRETSNVAAPAASDRPAQRRQAVVYGRCSGRPPVRLDRYACAE